MTDLWDADTTAAVAEELDAAVPGSVALGAVDYVARLLTALDHEPPRIWAAPGGAGWLELGPWERHAWAERIASWREAYERVGRGEATDADRRVVHEHACESTYGDPAYGGNRSSGGWQAIAFPEPIHPPLRGAAG
jgi:hypothetical protein